MAKYQATSTNMIIRASDGAHIPPDIGNADYREYLEWETAGGVIDPCIPPPPPPTSLLSQDLAAQFTLDDAAKIKAAIDGNMQFWLLWSAMQAQSGPMVVTNARFVAGWSALVSVLGQPRMNQIAAALGVNSLVA
jgi:hypothetical protein